MHFGVPKKGCDRQTKNAGSFKKRVLDEIDREIGLYSDDTTKENLVAVIVLLKLSRVISEWRDEE